MAMPLCLDHCLRSQLPRSRVQVHLRVRVFPRVGSLLLCFLVSALIGVGTVVSDLFQFESSFRFRVPFNMFATLRLGFKA